MLPWKATEDSIKETPSRKHGIDAETETKLRIYGCELIQSAGVLLKLPQVASATAQVLFQRFYFTSSFARHDVREMAAGALFLSCKIVEEPKKTRDVCNVFHRLFQREDELPQKFLEAGSEEYWDLKNSIIRAERWILKELGFFVQVILPHKYVINFVKVIDGSPEVTQKAWNYANDSLRTTCCVQYLPEKIATTCIYLAVRVLQVPLPEDWFLLFDTTREQIEEIGLSIMKLYHYPKAIYIEAKWDCWTNTSFGEEVDPSYRPEVLPHLLPRKKPQPPQPEEPQEPEPTNQNEEQLSNETSAQQDASSNNKRSRSRSRERDRERDRNRDRDRDRDRYRDDRDRKKTSDSRDKDRDRDRYRDKDRDRDRYRRSRSPRDRRRY